MRALVIVGALTLLGSLSSIPARADDEPKAPAPAPAEAIVDARTRALPPGWSEIRVIEHPQTTVKQVATKLGTSFERLTERRISLNGFPLKLNIIQTKDADAARGLHERLARMRGGAWFRRSGRDVVETATDNLLVARRTWAWLGLTQGDTSRWSFSARLGVVDGLDYMQANPVFNHFLAIEQGKSAAEAGQAIAAAVADWKPGHSLTLLTGKRLGFEASYAFTPKPSAAVQHPLRSTFLFPELKSIYGVRYVDVVATVRVRARFTPEAVKGDPGQTEATAFWPADDAEIQKLAKSLTRADTTDRERVLALLRFVSLDVRYSGPVGSRHGVRKVLANRYGRCWDKSDVLVTLCRALGIPARQVAGWVPPLGAGHVWAEVRLSDEGWIPVDATTTWLGVSQDYIPLYATDDGQMPIVYLAMPKVEPLR